MFQIGLSALTRVLQRVCDQERCEDDIVVSHVHPGYVNTDMCPQGALTLDRGAQAPVMAALLTHSHAALRTPHDQAQRNSLRGGYLWHDCQLVDWVTGPLPPSPWKRSRPVVC